MKGQYARILHVPKTAENSFYLHTSAKAYRQHRPGVPRQKRAGLNPRISWKYCGATRRIKAPAIQSRNGRGSASWKGQNNIRGSPHTVSGRMWKRIYESGKVYPGPLPLAGNL